MIGEGVVGLQSPPDLGLDSTIYPRILPPPSSVGFSHESPTESSVILSTFGLDGAPASTEGQGQGDGNKAYFTKCTSVVLGLLPTGSLKDGIGCIRCGVLPKVTRNMLRNKKNTDEGGLIWVMTPNPLTNNDLFDISVCVSGNSIH